MLPEGTILGRLKIEEVYIEYDGPQLFSCSDDAKRKRYLLAVHAPSTPSSDNWLYVYIGARRLKDVASGRVTLHSGFSEPKDGKVRMVRFDPKGTVEVLSMPPSQVPQTWFPMPGERLGEPGNAYLALSAEDVSEALRVSTPEQLPSFLREPAPMWEMSPPVIQYLRLMRTPVSEVSRRTGRSVMDFILKPPNDRSEMPAGVLGSFLIATQGAVEALAPPPPPGTKGSSPAEFARMNALPAFPGSFGIRLDTDEASLFPNPRLVESLHRIAALLASSSDHVSMRGLLKEYGQRGASKFRAFAQALEKSDSDVAVEIGIPNETAITVATLSRMAVSNLVEFLKGEAASTQETLTFRGQLVGVTIGTKFFALEDDERIVSGRIAEAALASMFGRVIGDRYDGNITAITDINEATGQERVKYILNSLEPVVG